MMRLSKRLVFGFALLFLTAGCAVDSAPRDLRELARSSSPNDSLACPPATCAAEPNFESPTLRLPAARLGEIVREVIAGEARTTLVDEDPELAQSVFVQRSRVFRFPDTIWIQVVDLKPRASVIVYSRSNVGRWDLGVNAQRVRDWLAKIVAAATAETLTPAAGS
jgi:uncharacterized protein (DUF1499 family)